MALNMAAEIEDFVAAFNEITINDLINSMEQPIEPRLEAGTSLPLTDRSEYESFLKTFKKI